MIVTMLHWFIKELITKHPSDASELIKASCHGFRFAWCLLALLQGCQPQQLWCEKIAGANSIVILTPLDKPLKLFINNGGFASKVNE